MRWSNVLVIFSREVRDQFRDRRTLFMIFVLPLLLYPLLGMGIIRMTSAFEQKARTVAVVGWEHLPPTPRLLDPSEKAFDKALFDRPADAKLLDVIASRKPENADPDRARTLIRDGLVDAVIVIPPDVAKSIADLKRVEIRVLYDSTDEPSQVTYRRLRDILSAWNDDIVAERLKADKRPIEYVEPILARVKDLATVQESGGSMWARIFPFLLVIMSLTGAFYPSVDICAGEKERGTMETLLISPASRAEIVLGKFLTIWVASMMTALLNLASMGITGLRLASLMGSAATRSAAQIAPPTMTAAFWMLLLLLPLSAFFSAICLALAIMAKSMKEGQYYMTPLYLISLPLILLTLAPEVELDLTYSLIPITGVSLLLKALLLGEYAKAQKYFIPVLVPTIVYGAMALRWAVDQFQKEDVVFREAERFDLMSWLKSLVRDKDPTPTPGEAMLCFLLMLGFAWFWSLYSEGLVSRPVQMAGGHLAFILAPPLLMSLLLCSSPRKTLRLYWPEWKYLGLAVGLAFSLNPIVRQIGHILSDLFPISEGTLERIKELTQGLSKTQVFLMLAAMPAVTEEVAFRGYILSGLQRKHRTRSAILLSALLFGFLHVLISVFQQLIPATLLGLVLGLLAVRSKSLLPGVVFHLISNGQAVLIDEVLKAPGFEGLNSWLFQAGPDQLYRWPILAVGVLVSGCLLYALYRDGDRKPSGAAVTTEAGGT